MQTWTATIKDGPKTLVDSVTVYVEEAGDGAGLQSWYGTFGLPAGKTIEPGGPYQIELNGERRGDILVTSIMLGSRGPGQVAFLGTGPLESLT